MSLEIEKVLEKFKEVKVLIVGDVMLDRYWWGSVNRISPEAPVPVVNLEKESLVVGGAGNVAANVKGLGATPYLLGIIGDDAEGKVLRQTLKKEKISADYLISLSTRPTTVKTRIVAHQQQVARIDRETGKNLSNSEEEIVWDILQNLLDEIDIVVVSDYAKGLLTDNLLTRLITQVRSNGKKILIDPKGKNYLKYSKATLLTPNRKEAKEATDLENMEEAGEKLLAELNLEAVLITKGEDGMTIFEKDKEPVHLEALARHVYDVTGAGDTVIGTLATALGTQADLVTSAKIANAAAGFVVEEVGTTAITFDKLLKEVNW